MPSCIYVASSVHIESYTVYRVNYTMQFSNQMAKLYSIVQYSTVQNSTVQYSTVQYSIVPLKAAKLCSVSITIL